MKKVFIISGASFDHIVYLPQFPKPIPQTIHHSVFNEAVGSTGSGKATNLAALGFDVTLHALIGDDIYGERIKKFLNKPNLKLIYDIDLAGTQRHINLMNQNGERISIFVNCSSPQPPVDYSTFEPLIKKSDYVVVNILNYARYSIPYCNKYGKEIWTDLHDYDENNPYHQDFIDAANYIFLSSDNLLDYKPFMMRMIKAGKKLVVCTHSQNGATALDAQGNWYFEPVINRFNRVDTNGAGDSFFAAYLYGFSRNYDVRKCLRLGHVAAGMCIESKHLYSENLNGNAIEQYYKNVFP